MAPVISWVWSQRTSVSICSRPDATARTKGRADGRRPGHRTTKPASASAVGWVVLVQRLQKWDPLAPMPRVSLPLVRPSATPRSGA